MKTRSLLKQIALLLCAAIFAAVLALPLLGCTPKADSLAFEYNYYRVKVGETVSPVVNIQPEGTAYDLSTEFAGIATIENGAVKGVNPGITLLTATSGELTARTTIEVVYSGAGTAAPSGDNVQVFYVIDQAANSFFINTVKKGGLASDIALGRDGYDLKGWYADPKFNTRFDFSVPITDTVKIYGKFTPVQGDQTPLEYKTIGNYEVEVTGLTYPKVPYTEIEIPQTTLIRGTTYTVARVAAKAFEANKTLTSVVMNHIKTVGEKAFFGCTNLSDIKADQLSKVYINAFTGTKWLSEEAARTYTVFEKEYYHGAQLGSCYVFADDVDAIYLLEGQHPQVTSFAAQSVMRHTLLYVPEALYNYYYNMEELKDIKANIRGYVFENGQIKVTRP